MLTVFVIDSIARSIIFIAAITFALMFYFFSDVFYVSIFLITRIVYYIDIFTETDTVVVAICFKIPSSSLNHFKHHDVFITVETNATVRSLHRAVL